MQCGLRRSDPLRPKGITLVFECPPTNREVRGLHDVKEVAKEVCDSLIKQAGISPVKCVFTENEPIGTNYLLYTFRGIGGDGEHVFSCRIVVHNYLVVLAVCTLGSKYVKDLALEGMDMERIHKYRSLYEKNELIPNEPRGKPPGQKYIPDFVIYRILGQPEINVRSWSMKVGGLVRKPLELTYEELIRKSSMEYVSDFHCVTGWSVQKVKWRGIPTKSLAEEASVNEDAAWVFVRSLDNYTTVVPLEDFLRDNAIIALFINDRPLSLEQGFPARLFIPHLYGWKSAKWVTEILFESKYRDGYWEALGYHERGNVWLEERFKRLD